MNSETLAIINPEILFEPLSTDYLSLLHKWIREPHVWQWWGEGRSWTFDLKFGELKEVTIQIQRMNPKRVQRQVRREMEKMKETTRPSTLAQDYMREEIEKKKKGKALAVLKNKLARMSNSQ